MRYKSPQLVAQHCFVASFESMFGVFHPRDVLVAQQKHLLRVEGKQRAGWSIFLVRIQDTIQVR